MSTPKKRIIAIDILKVMAVIVVLNSHMEICYGDYSFLATGGAIGDALFFFCSGFMLFRGNNMRFDNFMKRRISRIYPTVFVVSIVGALLFEYHPRFISVILGGGGWFVSCIMIYYMLLWFIKSYCIRNLHYVWLAAVAIIIGSFYIGFEYRGNITMYGETQYKWAAFFLFILQGAVMGLEPDKHRYNLWVIPGLILCCGLWFVMMILTVHSSEFKPFQYLSLLPLLGVTYYAYRLCCAPFWTKLYDHHYIGQLFYIIGGLCLECYLIQGFLLTDKLNFLFPLNIIILMVFILGVSYIINFMSNGFAQTFHKEEYEWRKCFLKKP